MNARLAYRPRTAHTQIAISFSTADLDFAKQIGEMLEQLSYIDDCDTLGQRTNKEDIHQVIPCLPPPPPPLFFFF